MWSHLVRCFPHFSLAISLFRRTSKHSDKVPCTIPKHKEVMMYVMEKINVLYKLHSGLNYCAGGHEVNVSELVCIRVVKQKHRKSKFV